MAPLAAVYVTFTDVPAPALEAMGYPVRLASLGGMTHGSSMQGGGPSIDGIHVDKEGTWWLASSAGLIRFQDGKSAVFSRKNGLLSDYLYQVLEDDQGRLWMTCNRGVFSASKGELNRVADGLSDQANYRAYGSSDGMKSAECDGGGSPAGCRRLRAFACTRGCGASNFNIQLWGSRPRPDRISIQAIGLRQRLDRCGLAQGDLLHQPTSW